MTTPITLAHLSDVHLSPVEGFSARHWNVKRGLGYLNWRHRRRWVHSSDVLARLIADMTAQCPDHIAVTGDLINLGLPAEYDAALAWLERLGSPRQVTVVPGNHDIYVRLRRDPGVRRWAPYMAPCAWGRTVAPPGDFPFARRVGPMAVIGLNSAIPTPPFVAAGQLGRKQLAALAELLDRAARANLIRVLLIHHPPLTGEVPARRALRDAAELMGILVAHGAELVLHGHDHADALRWQRTRTGPMLVAGIGSGSAGRRHGREPLARYNLFRIDRGAGGAVRIEVVGRGLVEAGGQVIDIKRDELVPPLQDTKI